MHTVILKDTVWSEICAPAAGVGPLLLCALRAVGNLCRKVWVNVSMRQ